MDPASLALLLGGTIFGGFFSGMGASSSASKSLQATRETNAQNYKIWQEQKQHEIDMWNMQNEYNDPSAQVERLRNAGLNPYLALQNGASTGIATSAPGSGQAPTMQTPGPEAFQSPWTSIFTGLASGAISFGQAYSNVTNANTNKAVGDSQIGLNNSQIGLNKANTEMTLLNKDWAPKLWGSQIGLNDSQTALNKTANQFEQDTFQVRKDMLHASLAGMQLSNVNQRIMNEYLPAEKQMGLMMQTQTLTNMIAQLDLTKAQTKETLAKIKVHLTQSILNTANAGLATAQTKYYNTLEAGAQIDNKQKQLDYNTASALADDMIQTTLVENSMRRSQAILEDIKASGEVDARRWGNGFNVFQITDALKYVTDPLRGILGGTTSFSAR